MKDAKTLESCLNSVWKKLQNNAVCGDVMSELEGMAGQMGYNVTKPTYDPITGNVAGWMVSPIIAMSQEKLLPCQKKRIELWRKFNEINAAMGSKLKMVSEDGDAMKHNGHYFSVGGNGFCVVICFIGQKHKVEISYLTFSKEKYQMMSAMTQHFEVAVGRKLEWKHSTSKRYWSKLTATIPGLDCDNTSNYPSLLKEVIETTIKMQDAFQKLGFAKTI